MESMPDHLGQRVLTESTAVEGGSASSSQSIRQGPAAHAFGHMHRAMGTGQKTSCVTASFGSRDPGLQPCTQHNEFHLVGAHHTHRHPLLARQQQRLVHVFKLLVKGLHLQTDASSCAVSRCVRWTTMHSVSSTSSSPVQNSAVQE